jgi:hypothetical protein
MDAGASAKPNLMLKRQGDDGKSEATGSTQTSSQTSSESRQKVDDTNIRTRTSGSVGVETRERSGVSVRSRTTVHDEPSVSVRRRSVTTVEDDEPSVVVKKKRPAKKVVVKKKPSARYAVRSRRVVEDEPSVSVRRRTVRTYEENEPSVSVRNRTTVRGGVNIERNNTSSSTSIRRESDDSNVSASTGQKTNTETTGSVSSTMEKSSSGVKANASGSSEAGGKSRLLRRQGGSMDAPQ